MGMEICYGVGQNLLSQKMLSFLRQNYQYDVRVKLNDNTFVTIDFKTHDRYIEVVDSEDDIEKFKTVQKKAARS